MRPVDNCLLVFVYVSVLYCLLFDIANKSIFPQMWFFPDSKEKQILNKGTKQYKKICLSSTGHGNQGCHI